MHTYRIHGINRLTGDTDTTTIQADDPDTAAAIAAQQYSIITDTKPQLLHLHDIEAHTEPPQPRTLLGTCPDCQHPASINANTCPHCGAALRDNSTRYIGALLNLLLPGLGHIYQGRTTAGILILLFTILTIWILIGLIIWIVAILEALTYTPPTRILT